MSIAQQLFNQSFPNGAVKSIKSQAYLSVVLETLEFKETGSKLKNSFELGSYESDAWNAGNREGHGLWSDYQYGGEVMSSNARQLRESRRYVDHQTGSTDIVHQRISQINSLLTILTGEGFESFKRYNDDIQDDVLWTCKVLADDIEWHTHHEDEHLKEDIAGDAVLITDQDQIRAVELMRQIPKQKQEEALNLFKALFDK